VGDVIPCGSGGGKKVNSTALPQKSRVGNTREASPGLSPQKKDREGNRKDYGPPEGANILARTFPRGALTEPDVGGGEGNEQYIRKQR